MRKVAQPSLLIRCEIAYRIAGLAGLGLAWSAMWVLSVVGVFGTIPQREGSSSPAEG